MLTEWLHSTVGPRARRAFRRPARPRFSRLRVEALEDRLAPAALVAAYAFDAGTGSTVADASGNGNSGTIVNATWTTAGKYGNALSFNGTSARVNINNAASLLLTTGMTLEAWVRPTTITSAWRDVIYKGNDNYYLMATTDHSSLPGGGIIAGGTYAETFGTTTLALNTWTHLATTYDGAMLRLYVNGIQVSSVAKTGNILTSTNQLQIGGDSIYGQYFAGTIDEVRVYNAALTAAQVQTDMNTPITPDTQPPTAPTNLNASANANTITLNWTASTDNVGVTGYRVERKDPASSTFVLVGTATGTTYTDGGLAANSSYSYQVRATDAAGNLSAYSNVASATTGAPDTTPPVVALTNPTNGAIVGGTVTLAANATDNVGVAGVQFLLDGASLGAEVTIAPYTLSWNSSTVSLGSHTLSARARDAAGNSTVSSVITVSVVSPNDPAVIGQWSSVINWPLVAINMALLDNGKILMWDGGQSFCQGGESARVWDPATNTFTPVPLLNPDGSERDLFCSAQVALADGRVLEAGGHACGSTSFVGTAIATVFDPATGQWVIEPDMAYRRYYPTATTLPDGRALVTSGSAQSDTGDYIPVPEVFDPRTNTWTTLNGANLTIHNYPFVFVLPDGKVLAAGSDESIMASWVLNVATQSWTVVDSRALDGGSAVMYLPGKVMKAGSSYIAGDLSSEVGRPSAATTYVLDMTQPSPAWLQTASMANPRTHLNLTVLPDGNVLATGGSSDLSGIVSANGVLPAEMWSPLSQSWTTLASMQIPRMYHSTALLLPDGRILSAGGGRATSTTTDYLNAEIYSPPYLFKGARPTITAAPTTLAYNSGFFIQTPDAASIASVALIRTGSVTHGVNMDQRFVPLTFTQGSGGLNVQAPANANLAPPGYYMLFIVNSNGVPSIAPFVRLPAPYEDVQPPTAPTNLTATGGIGTAALSWTAATDNIGVVRYDVYRSTTPGFTPSAANRIAQPTTVSYTDTGLAAGTYYYRVSAEDAAGNISAPSAEASVNVLADTVPPTAPTNLGLTVVSGIQINLSWTAATDNVGVTGYRVERSQGTGNTNFVQIGTATGTTFSDTGLSSSTVYNYQVRATDAAGNLGPYSNVASATTLAKIPGLVAAYSFNAGTGSTLADASGQGNTGTIVNATWTTAGKYGNALSFNGTNARVDINDAASLHLTTAMTLEAWVNPTAVSSAWRDVVYKGNDNYYLMGTTDHSSLPGGGIIAAGTYAETFGTTHLATNTWTYLATTYDGTFLRLFVNGIQVSSVAKTGNILTSTNQLQIGGDSIYGQYFSGLIDEVRVYNQGLTQAQIQADMNTPVGSPMRLLGEEVNPADAAPLSGAGFRPLFDEAVTRWSKVLNDVNAVRRLRGVDVEVMDLPGTTLGLASGTVIFIDINAAGHGWFVDPTPWEDSEFAPGLAHSPAAGRADLLTVLTHEMGHVLGLDDDSAADPYAGNVMGELLPLGVRRIVLQGLEPATLGISPPPGITVQTADLSGRHLDMVGVATIRIDANAASWGRIFYATPLDDEFPTPGYPGGQGRMNVLTVLKPESGQVPDFNSQEVKTLDTTAWLTAAAVASPRNYWDGLDLAFVPPDRVWEDFLK